jgi:hypothetical protein
MLMMIEENPIQNTLQVETALFPSESAGQTHALRTTLLEDGGKIVASAPLAAKAALRALTDEWGLQISGMPGQNLVDHAKALDLAVHNVYSTLDEGATRSLHLMHLLLLRQDRFFVAHLGASDVYLVRERKVHPLALAPSLRKLEESLGFEFESPGKLEPERVACGSFTWPELPVLNLIGSGLKAGDYLLFTSPGLFEQRDWPGILGSLARAEAPFDQATVRLARVGHARLRAEGDGYLLVHVPGVVEPAAPPPASARTAEDSQTLRALAPTGMEEVAQKALRHQLEFPASTGTSRPGGAGVGIGIAIVAMMLLGLLLLAPRFRGAPATSAPDQPGRTPRAGANAGLVAPKPPSYDGSTNVGGTPGPEGALRAAMPASVREDPKPTPNAKKLEDPPPPQIVAPPKPTIAAVSATPAAPKAAEFLAMDSASKSDPFAQGRDLARAGKFQQSSDLFRQLVADRAGAFTIQVGVVSKPETVMRYFRNAAGDTRLMLFVGKDRNFLTIGLFDSEADAWTAVQRLPEFFRRQNAVVKPLGRILADLPEQKSKDKPKPKPADPT